MSFFRRYKLPDSVNKFRIDETSGLVYKISGVVFDREEIKEIQLPIIAYDGPGTPSRSTVVLVYISIKVGIVSADVILPSQQTSSC